MSEPREPVERGLRATVRMAAGINIGDGPETSTVFGGLLDRLRAAAPLLPEALAHDRAHHVRTLRHGVAGAVIGAGLVGAGFVAMAAHAALAQDPAPATEQVLTAVEPVAKGDRLAVAGGKLAAIATSIDRPDPIGTDITITARADVATTAAMPALAFASADLRDVAVAAIDRVLEAPPIAAPQLSIAPQITEEEADDEAVEPLILPMPRVRPHIETTTLPVPKPRPQFASLTPPGVAAPGVGEEPVAPPPRRAAEPEARPSGNLLGFFSSPTEPVKAPSRTTVETPFGVPYVLQTGSVETACLKPELVDILRRIEGHYRQKVVITSGFRDRGRQGSLHRSCAAVDIEVPGVDAASLAGYARTIPGIGGVGTYCYPRLIHVDIGTPRDWKYGCGSFFAMRGAPGKWGKVPTNLAKAQPAGSSQVAGAATEED